MCDKQKCLNAFEASRKQYQYMRVCERDWGNGRFSESYWTGIGLHEFWAEIGINDYERVEFDQNDGVLSLYDGFKESHLRWVDSGVVGKKVVAYAELEAEDSDLLWAGESPCFDEWIRELGGIPVKLDLTPEQIEELDGEIHEVNAQIGVPAPGGVFYALETVQGMIDDILAETVHGA